MPEISIILPTYNGSKYIQSAIASVQSQTSKNWELLVIDDGSKDATEEVVKAMAGSDTRIIYIKNELNLGLQKTLNKGIALARASLLARIDDDDEWIDSAKLEKQLSFLQSHPKCVLVGTWFKRVTEEGTLIDEVRLPESDADIRKKILSYNPFGHSTVLFRKDIALRSGGYDETLQTKHMEDHDLWMKMGTMGEFANLPIISTSYIVKKGMAQSNTKMRFLRFRIRVLYKYFFVYKGRFSSLAYTFAHVLLD